MAYGRRNRRRRRGMRRRNYIVRQPVSIAANDAITVVLYKDYTIDLRELSFRSTVPPLSGGFRGTAVNETNSTIQLLNSEMWLNSRWQTRGVTQNNTNVTAITGFQFVHFFTPSLYPMWSNWAALYRKYKIQQCGIKFFPMFVGGMQSMYDLNQSTVSPAGAADSTQRRPYPEIAMKFDVNRPASITDLGAFNVGNFVFPVGTNGIDIAGKIWYWWLPSEPRQCLYEPGWTRKKFTKPRKYTWTPVTTDEYQLVKGENVPQLGLSDVNKNNYKYPEFELVDQENLVGANLENQTANPTFYMGPEFFFCDMPDIPAIRYVIRVREWVSITFRDQKLPNI